MALEWEARVINYGWTMSQYLHLAGLPHTWWRTGQNKAGRRASIERPVWNLCYKTPSFGLERVRQMSGHIKFSIIPCGYHVGCNSARYLRANLDISIHAVASIVIMGLTPACKKNWRIQRRKQRKATLTHFATHAFACDKHYATTVFCRQSCGVSHASTYCSYCDEMFD